MEVFERIDHLPEDTGSRFQSFTLLITKLKPFPAHINPMIVGMGMKCNNSGNLSYGIADVDSYRVTHGKLWLPFQGVARFSN